MFPSAFSHTGDVIDDQQQTSIEKLDWLSLKSFKQSVTDKTIEVKPSYTDGDIKPSYTDGDIKPSYTDGDVKPSYTDGEVKPSYTDGDVKPSYTDKTEEARKLPWDGSNCENVDRQASLESSEDMYEHRHHKKKRKKGKDKKKKKKRSKSEVPDKDDQSYNKNNPRNDIFTGNKVFLEEIPGLQLRDAYRVDRKSDVNTWNYGSLYKGHVPVYHDFINKCLGSTGLNFVEMKDKKKKRIESKRYYCKESRKLVSNVPMETLNYERGQADHEMIAITSCDQDTSDVRQRLMDPATLLYVEGKGVNREEKDEENVIINQTVAQYNKKIRENPKDITAWLDFIEFQDKLAAEDNLPESSIQEKKVSIIKKALEANPGCIQLKMKYLDLCKDSLSFDDVTKEMEQFIFLNPTNMSLWKQYLLYNQSCVSKFSVSNVSKAYYKCFRKLSGYLNGQLHTHTPNPHLHQDVLDVFVQYCYFLKQVGQTEKAVASFQAQIEFNLFRPNHEDPSYQFESFWDSGVPRVAEEGAKGWSYWFHKKEAPPEMANRNAENEDDLEKEILKSNDKKWKIWMNIEVKRQQCHWLPWKPDENETIEDCEDLDRLVLFDDIKEILITFPSSLHVRLIDRFLQFLGITIDHSDLPTCAIEDLHHIVRNSEITTVRDYLDESPRKQSLVDCCIDQMIDKCQGEDRVHFIVTKMYLSYNLGQKAKNKISKFKKFVKTLLKQEQNRNDLTLWAAYCDILCKFGCHLEAVTVMETALTFVSDNVLGRLRLYQKLTETHLGMTGETSKEVFNLSKAQNALLCFTMDKLTSVDDLSTTLILRSRKKLESLCDSSMKELTNLDTIKLLHQNDLDYICGKFRMLSLFEYSFGKYELDEASSVLEDAVSHLNQFIKAYHSEQSVVQNVEYVMTDLLCFSVRLIKHHMSVNTTPLSMLRKTLNQALKIFPNNSHFLHEFINIELKTYISGRLDRHFSHVIRSADSAVPVVYGVYAILCRQANIEKHLQMDNIEVGGTIFGGLVNRLRSYLELSLRRTSLSQCPLVWRLYLYIEVKFGGMSRAHGLFFRALQSCPWSKALYLDAVSIFDGDKTEEIIDLMMEKEIRLQIPYEEVDILLDLK